jgi:predicted unusual protein kinase regulating ubiquinone biosynthesis (AarF/ABC1/UbiB family)
MALSRTERIERAVDAGLNRWPDAVSAIEDEMPQPPAESVSAVRPMPRRAISHAFTGANVALPRARKVTFKAGVIRTVLRLLLWISGAMKFFLGNWLDVVLRRDSPQRRAVRLRQIFEGAGATFAKLGQQLSLRADLLPYTYCVELSKMLDRSPPFPSPEAIAIVERSLGRPIGEVFAAFDPIPIGSGSLACVYQAQLKTGERVAVKVRRPGVGPTIAADLRALDWLLNTAEALTYVTPGMTRRFRQELRTILFGELNFRTEARYTDMFRRNARKHNGDVTAPRMYFQYCTEEMLVGELVSGVWMWELMAAVDSNDVEFLTKLRGMGIEPKSLARKLAQVMQREVQEELFFHADPHPANLVVLPNNRICFIDFGAIGRFSTPTRKVWREIMFHMVQGDVSRMVNCSLNLGGPLPPIDVHGVSKEIEQIYADWLYAMKSKDAEWWERSSAQAWLRYIEIARKYNIPVTLETIQFFRATVLYDSTITRLNRDIDFTKEYKVYARIANKRARKRVQKRMRMRLDGPTDQDYMNFEQISDSITQFVFNIGRTVENQTVHFRSIVGKISYVAALFLRLGYLAAFALGTGLLVDTLSSRLFGHKIDWPSILEAISSFGWVQLTLVVVLLVLIRRVVLRLSMPDSRPDPDR